MSFWATSRSALYQYALMLSASTSMPCSSIAFRRSVGCDMSSVGVGSFMPSRAIASGTLQWAWTSTVFTRRPFTTTSRRRVAVPAAGAGACAGVALSRWHPVKATPVGASLPWSMNSRCMVIVTPLLCG